jgi:hypothetical protein
MVRRRRRASRVGVATPIKPPIATDRRSGSPFLQSVLNDAIEDAG